VPVTLRSSRVPSAALIGVGVVLALMAAPRADAETRRALLVGIDKYVQETRPALKPPAAGVPSASPDRRRGGWFNLDGAVNDAEELRQILIARYGFHSADVHVLTNAQATRERILAEARRWLIDGASAGDVSLFFYAGHGSQMKNSRSPEADKLDETIVPADANRGALDIRDKELAALFGPALDKKVLLTLIVDSCHSGSIGRGAPRATKFRFVQPDQRDAADASVPTPLEARGAVVLSAAQDYQLAAETEDEAKRPHGLFSWALVKTLRSMPLNQSADRTFLQIRALMQSGDIVQNPVLAATMDRRQAPLFGTGTSGSGALVVAVQRVNDDGSVILEGGIGAGLRKDAELRRAAEGSEALRLRVTEEQGLALSRAVAIDGGTTKGLEPGSLFEVVRWTAANGPALRVWIGPTDLGLAEVRRHAAAFAALSGAPGRLIDDPTTAANGARLLQWSGSAWQILSQAEGPRTVGITPTAPALATLLEEDRARPLMMTLPLPAEVGALLNLGARSENDAIEVLPSREHADYLLLGRARGGSIEYAWVRPLVTGAEAGLTALPARSEWVALNDGPETLATALRQQALRLGRIRSWLQLDSPANARSFPYHLALENTVTGEIRTTGPTRDEERYDVVLTLDEAMAREPLERRFVYVFALDSDGRSTLLFPDTNAGGVENRLPILGTDASPPNKVRLQAIKVSAPFGVDTFVLLTSATPLPDPSVLAGDPVRGREGLTRGVSDPLSRLLAQTGAGRRGVTTPTPTEWSLERLSIQSLPAAGKQ
jgi:caspase domain-containing protein